MFNKRLGGALAALLMLASADAWAGVTAERTRLVLTEGQREASLALVNQNAYPVIVQTWIDDGALDAEPDTAEAPFMPLPAVFRLEAGQQRSVRVLATGQALPDDHESLFWLNLYEIPPQDKAELAEGQARLTVTLRTQMKVIYRPKALEADAERAPERLRFTWAGDRVQVDNPTPYCITLAGVSVRHGTALTPLPGETLAPFSQHRFAVQAPRLARGDQVAYQWLDDGGNTQAATSRLR